MIIDYWFTIIDYWLLIYDYWFTIYDYWLLIYDLRLLICTDFADALANPIQYLSENEKRTQQLEALLMDESAESVNNEQAAQRVSYAYRE